MLGTLHIWKLLLLVEILTSGYEFRSPSQKFLDLCPRLYQKTFKGYVPKGNVSAGNISFIYTILVLKKSSN